MADNYTDDDFETEDFEDVEAAESSPKGLRRAANKSKKLEQELLAAKRELAFARAGIDPDDPRMRYFVKGYDGELSAGAVKQAAIEAGFVTAPQEGQDPALQQASQAQQRVMSAAAGAVMEDASEEAAFARMAAAMEEGGTEAMLDVARQYGIPIGTEQ